MSKDNAPQDFAVLRRIALNLVNRDKTAKCGINGKRLQEGLNEANLLQVPFG